MCACCPSAGNIRLLCQHTCHRPVAPVSGGPFNGIMGRSKEVTVSIFAPDSSVRVSLLNASYQPTVVWLARKAESFRRWACQRAAPTQLLTGRPSALNAITPMKTVTLHFVVLRTPYRLRTQIEAVIKF